MKSSIFLLALLEALGADEPGVSAIAFQETVVSTLLDDGSLRYNGDVVRFLDRRKLVSNDQSSSVLANIIQCLLDNALCVRIKRRSCFISASVLDSTRKKTSYVDTHNNRIFGFAMMLRAMATLWHWPPDSIRARSPSCV